MTRGKSIPAIADSTQTACFHPHQSGQMRTSHWGQTKHIYLYHIKYLKLKSHMNDCCGYGKISFWTGLCALVNKGMTLYLRKKDPRDKLTLQISTQNLLSST